MAGLVLGPTIKPESFRTHIGPVCSTRFRTFKGGRQSPSSNRDGHLYIGLKLITFTVGWYNIERGETFSWRSTGGPEETLNIPPGLYGFDRLKEVLEGASSSPTHTLAVSRENGLITLTVAPERGNIVNGAPSTLLAGIGLGRHAFGDINTVRMECPEYKRLRDGTVGELKVSIRDASGKAISNQDLPIHVTLAVIKNEHLRRDGLPRV